MVAFGVIDLEISISRCAGSKSRPGFVVWGCGKSDADIDSRASEGRLVISDKCGTVEGEKWQIHLEALTSGVR